MKGGGVEGILVWQDVGIEGISEAGLLWLKALVW